MAGKLYAGPLLLAALAGLSAAAGVYAQAPALPPGPVPVAPNAPGVTPPVTPAPQAPVLGPPAPACPGPQVLPAGPPPGPPPYIPFQDRNGPLLRGEPLLEGCDQPGWFGAVDIAVVAPHIKNSLVAPVTIPGASGPRTVIVHVPQAELDWTGAPRFEVGYRLPEGFGEFLVSYRLLVSEGTDSIPNFDVLGPATLKSRLNLNVVDLDYASREFSLAPLWDMKWQAGVRIASIFFDSRADGQVKEERTSNDFVGAGPHIGLELARHFDVPGLSAFARLDYGLILGGITQNFEETFSVGGTPVLGGATKEHGTQAVDHLTFETGLSYAPPDLHHARFSVGYFFEEWWYLGQIDISRGQLIDQGVFFRSEFNF
jgi:hypothetical protein